MQNAQIELANEEKRLERRKALETKIKSRLLDSVKKLEMNNLISLYENYASFLDLPDFYFELSGNFPQLDDIEINSYLGAPLGMRMFCSLISLDRDTDEYYDLLEAYFTNETVRMLLTKSDEEVVEINALWSIVIPETMVNEGRNFDDARLQRYVKIYINALKAGFDTIQDPTIDQKHLLLKYIAELFSKVSTHQFSKFDLLKDILQIIQQCLPSLKPDNNYYYAIMINLIEGIDNLLRHNKSIFQELLSKYLGAMLSQVIEERLKLHLDHQSYEYKTLATKAEKILEQVDLESEIAKSILSELQTIPNLKLYFYHQLTNNTDKQLSDGLIAQFNRFNNQLTAVQNLWVKLVLKEIATRAGLFQLDEKINVITSLCANAYQINGYPVETIMMVIRKLISTENNIQNKRSLLLHFFECSKTFLQTRPDHEVRFNYGCLLETLEQVISECALQGLSQEELLTLYLFLRENNPRARELDRIYETTMSTLSAIIFKDFVEELVYLKGLNPEATNIDGIPMRQIDIMINRTRPSSKNEDKSSREKFSLDKYRGSNRLPIYLALCEYPENECRKIMAAYNRFMQQYRKTNDMTIGSHRVSFEIFMQLYGSKILHLMDIMGEHAFDFMRSMISGSILALTRFIEGFNKIHDSMSFTLKTISERFSTSIIKNHSLQWQSILKIFSILYSKEKKYDYEIISKINEIFLGYIYASKTFTELYEKIVLNFYIKGISNIVDSIEGIDVKTLQDKWPVEKLTELIEAMSSMSRHHWQDIFLSLLQVDFSESLSFNDFITDEQQEAPIGREIARANATVRSELAQSNIHVDLAMSYPKKLAFSYEGDATTLLNSALGQVWKQAFALYGVLKKCIAHGIGLTDIEKEELNKVLRSFEKFYKQILRTSKYSEPVSEVDLVILEKLQEANIKNLFNRIMTSLTNVNEKVGDKLDQCIGHEEGLFMQRLTTLEQCCFAMNDVMATQPENKKTTLKVAKKFRVKQLDLSEAKTLMLGNQVSCCLATDGHHFSAIVQRRLDRAFKVHAVVEIDPDTNAETVVALNWLFLGKDKRTGDAYVVANFYEVVNKYGIDTQLAKLFRDYLTFFTGMYARDINAAGFLMRPLTYGMVPPFDDQALKTCEIEKVGDYIAPSIDITSDRTVQLSQEQAKKMYYLPALSINAFHQYDLATMTNLPKPLEKVQLLMKLTVQLVQELKTIIALAPTLRGNGVFRGQKPRPYRELEEIINQFEKKKVPSYVFINQVADLFKQHQLRNSSDIFALIKQCRSAIGQSPKVFESKNVSAANPTV